MADIVVQATKEDEVKTNLLTSSDHPSKASRRAVAQVAKPWLACRVATDLDNGLAAGTITENENTIIPAPPALYVRWQGKHDLVLGANRLLHDAFFSKLVRDFEKSPKTMSIVLLENVRLLSDGRKNTGSFISIDGKGAKAIQSDSSAVNGYIDLYCRTRALFTGYSIASAEDPGFCTYEAAEEFSDFVLEALAARTKGQRPMIDRLLRSFALTMQFFVTNVRQHNATLTASIKDRGQWSHFWTSPVEANLDSRGHPGSNTGEIIREPSAKLVNGTNGGRSTELTQVLSFLQAHLATNKPPQPGGDGGRPPQTPPKGQKRKKLRQQEYWSRRKGWNGYQPQQNGWKQQQQRR